MTCHSQKIGEIETYLPNQRDHTVRIFEWAVKQDMAYFLVVYASYLNDLNEIMLMIVAMP